MIRTVSAFFFLLVTATFCRAATEEQLAVYITGIAVLSAKTDMPDSVKALRYRDLERVSGMTAAEARLQLTSLRNRPEKWRTIHDRMMALMSEPQPAAGRTPPAGDTLTPRAKKRR